MSELGPDALTAELAGALRAMVDNHYCGHGDCVGALEALSAFEVRFGVAVTPRRLVRPTWRQRARWAISDRLARYSG